MGIGTKFPFEVEFEQKSKCQMPIKNTNRMNSFENYTQYQNTKCQNPMLAEYLIFIQFLIILIGGTLSSCDRQD